MTVVAALVTPEGAWMGADSLSSCNTDCVNTASPKVERIGRLVVGTAGSWHSLNAFRRHFRANRLASVEAIASDLEHDDEVAALVLDGRKLYLFEGSGCVRATTKRGISYGAVGLGGPIAMGSLHTQIYRGIVAGRHSVRTALAACETHSPWCRGPFKIIEAPQS